MDYLDHVNGLLRDLHRQSTPAQLWAWWLLFVVSAPALPLLRRRLTRTCGVAVAAAAVVTAAAMPFWYAEVGYTRLLGVPHFPVWVLLLAWLYRRRERLRSPPHILWTALVLAATIVVSLALDGANAIRYMLGERAPL